MVERLKIGLIGAGVFAGYHADKLRDHRRIDFVGIFDTNTKRAERLAQSHDVSALALRDLLSQSDAVVIASVASTHYEMALGALNAGCHCLIEKPLATTGAQAEAIADLADHKKLIVQVGHQERQVLAAIGLDRIAETPLKIDASRTSPASPRGKDTSATLDLMTHDIDLCTMLFRDAPLSVSGTVERKTSDHNDIAKAELIYASGQATLYTNRTVAESERVMVITYATGQVVIDFNAKTLKNTTPYDLNADFASDPQAADSLGAATDSFLRAVLDNAPVDVTAEDGALAVKIACRVDEGKSK
jgi:predicted dehydrogenase